MNHLDILNDMVAKKRIKSTKNISAIFIDNRIQIHYLYGSWVINEQGKEFVTGRSLSYEKFLQMVHEMYPDTTYKEMKIFD